jgi:dTDP-4-amino-4,6-dideoxygalactose transaminase
VFCDIDPEDFTLDTTRLEKLITPRTSAILPVHVYGNVCQTGEIERIAGKYNLKVIYDAAHAFGVTIKGSSVAGFGDASVFSFHATKVFNTIEGGAVTYKDKELQKRLDMEKNFGITGPESVETAGGNAKMHEFSAAMGLCNLRHIEEEIAGRKGLAERYFARLSGVKGIRLCPIPPAVKSNYAYLPVVFEGFKLSRDEVWAKLREAGIEARKYFYPLTSSFACYQGRFGAAKTPVAAYTAERILTLPLYAGLSPEEADKVCDIILGVRREA